MDATRDYHTKWNKSERERQMPYDITYMWNLKYDTQMNLSMKQNRIRDIDRWVPGGVEVKDGGLWLADASCYTEWIYRMNKQQGTIV